MSVYVFEGQAAGDHEHLGVVEELRELFGCAVAALMFGGHPCFGSFLDELLADRMWARLEKLGSARAGRPGGRPLAQPDEERLEGQVLPW